MEEAQEDGKCRIPRQALQSSTPQELLPRHGSVRQCQVLSIRKGGFVSCQATELCDAILEGYPKSKKQFFVSGSLSLPCSPGVPPRGLIHRLIAPQEEVGIETDEDYNVKLPDP